MANDKISESFYIGHLTFEIYLNSELWHLELNFLFGLLGSQGDKVPRSLLHLFDLA